MRAFSTVEQLTGPNGEWIPEATSDDADPMAYKVRYMPNPPETNWAEKARLDSLDAIRKEKGEGANMNGVYVTVRRVEY